MGYQQSRTGFHGVNYMTQGYITIAQNNQEVDYLEQAYALALSIKNTQSGVNCVSVMIDEETSRSVKTKHTKVFDKIIDMPWQDDALDSEWKINNKWKIYYVTPYDETVLLDSDMIFPADVSHWWDILCEKDFWSTTQTKTFRGDTVTNNSHRKVFTENNLPQIHNAFMYFKKSHISSEIFKMAEIIFQNWQRFYHLYLPNARPTHVSGDVVFALAIKILGYEHLTTRDNIHSLPTFVHMRGRIQGANVMDNWSKNIPSYIGVNQTLVVGNFLQTYPFHYLDKQWLTPEIIKTLESKHGTYI
jgi:hypothetical protein